MKYCSKDSLFTSFKQQIESLTSLKNLLTSGLGGGGGGIDGWTGVCHFGS